MTTCLHAGGRMLIVRVALLACLAGVMSAPSPAGAFSITANFDTSITNHPQAATIISTINTSIAQYQARISDPVNVTITFQRAYSGLGASTTSIQRFRYLNFLAALRSHASSTDDAIVLSHLPDGSTNPVNGSDTVQVSYPLARALGLSSGPQPGPGEAAPGYAVSIVGPSPGDPRAKPLDAETLRRLTTARVVSPAGIQANPDAAISLYLDLMNLTTGPTPANKYSLFAVVSHEIDEVLGSSSALNNLLNGATPPSTYTSAEDLFRYDVHGARSFNTSATDSSYLSLDGFTRLVRFNQTQGGDFSDFWSPGGGLNTPRVQDAFATLGADPVLDVEWRVLDALGWSYAPKSVWVDFAYAGGTQTGEYATPFPTLAQGVAAVPTGGVVLIKGNGTSTERPTLTKTMTITTVAGPATIGQ